MGSEIGGCRTAVSLLVGAGAVFALGRTGAGVEADAVVVLKSLGMTCGSCAGKIDAALKGKPGVDDVGVDVQSAQVVVAYDSKVVKPETLAEAVTAAGFRSGRLQTMSLEKYQTLTGRSATALAQTNSGGCACCNKN